MAGFDVGDFNPPNFDFDGEDIVTTTPKRQTNIGYHSKFPQDLELRIKVLEDAIENIGSSGDSQILNLSVQESSGKYYLYTLNSYTTWEEIYNAFVVDGKKVLIWWDDYIYLVDGVGTWGDYHYVTYGGNGWDKYFESYNASMFKYVNSGGGANE